MKSFQSIILFSLFLFFFTVVSQVSAATPDPTEQLKPVIDKVITLLKDSEFRQRPIVEQSEVIVKLVSERFDFHEMSKRVMGRHWRTLNSDQQEQFVGLFTKLLQYVYIRQVDDYINKKIEFTGQRIEKDRADVKSLLIDENKTIPVSYIMVLRNGQWMAYDIAVEGVSLIMNYRKQIATVLRAEKFPGLIAMLKEKISKLEKRTSNIKEKKTTTSREKV